MFLRSDEKIQKILVENDPNNYKQLLFLCDFGRYFELAEDKHDVFVCEQCLHVVSNEEKQDEMNCYNSNKSHSWKIFNNEEKLKEYIKDNISKHYASHTEE